MNSRTFQLTPDFMDMLMDVICVVGADNRIQFVSASCERVFGYTPQEMIGLSILDLIHPDDLDKTQQNIHDVISGHPNTGFENRYIHKDGHVVHISWSARWSESGQFRVGVARDVTARNRADKLRDALYAISEAAQQNDDLMSLFAQIHRIVGELIPARNFFIALHNGNTDELRFPYFVDEKEEHPAPCPLAADDFTARLIRDGIPLLLPADIAAPHQLGVPLKSQERAFGAVVVRSHSDSIRYSEADLELLQFVSDQIASAIHRTRLHADLRYAAAHDPLTGLANRALFHERLAAVLAKVRRQHGHFALLYLDLDKFKAVNDHFGHAAGDLLLQDISQRLRESVRKTDTIARMGGDEFVILLQNLTLPMHAYAVARKIHAALDTPYQLGAEPRPLTGRISASIGVAVYPDDGEDGATLLRHADADMYARKTADQPDVREAR